MSDIILSLIHAAADIPEKRRLEKALGWPPKVGKVKLGPYQGLLKQKQENTAYDYAWWYDGGTEGIIPCHFSFNLSSDDIYHGFGGDVDDNGIFVWKKERSCRWTLRRNQRDWSKEQLRTWMDRETRTLCEWRSLFDGDRFAETFHRYDYDDNDILSETLIAGYIGKIIRTPQGGFTWEMRRWLTTDDACMDDWEDNRIKKKGRTGFLIFN